MIAHDRLAPELIGTPVRVTMYAEAPREGVVVGLTEAGSADSAGTAWLQVDVGNGRIVERTPSQCTEVSRGPEGDLGARTRSAPDTRSTTF